MLHWWCGAHVMVPLHVRHTTNGASTLHGKIPNISAGCCFTLILFSLGVALWAAPPEAEKRYTSVVRADNRSGKLVRSMVVTSKPVTAQRVTPVLLQPSTVTAVAGAEPDAPSPAAGIDAAVARIAAEHA